MSVEINVHLYMQVLYGVGTDLWRVNQHVRNYIEDPEFESFSLILESASYSTFNAVHHF